MHSANGDCNLNVETTREQDQPATHGDRALHARVQDFTLVLQVRVFGLTKPRIKFTGGIEKREGEKERKRGREQSDGNKIPERTDG